MSVNNASAQGAGASADMQQMMGEMRSQNAEQMRNNLEMGRMSQQASMSAEAPAPCALALLTLMALS